jgi:hypothetical protein
MLPFEALPTCVYEYVKPKLSGLNVGKRSASKLKDKTRTTLPVIHDCR